MIMMWIVWLTLLVCLSATPISSQGDRAGTEELASAFEKLKGVKAVEGDAVGFAAVPGRFYRLHWAFLRYGDEDYYRQLLKDENPIIRVMGLLCLAKTQPGSFKNIAEPFLSDKATVMFNPYGCVRRSTTVGEIVRLLIENPDFLTHRKK